MVFENLKATFLEGPTLAGSVSRKGPISRASLAVFPKMMSQKPRLYFEVFFGAVATGKLSGKSVGNVEVSRRKMAMCGFGCQGYQGQPKFGDIQSLLRRF